MDNPFDQFDPASGFVNLIQHQEDPSGDPYVVSPKGARGTMQVMPDTARDPGFGVPAADPNNPTQLAQTGDAYSHAMLARYRSPVMAAAAYNAGPGTVDDWAHGTNTTGKNPGRIRLGDPRTGETTEQQFAANIPFRETRNYVRPFVKPAAPNPFDKFDGHPASANPFDQFGPPQQVSQPKNVSRETPNTPSAVGSFGRGAVRGALPAAGSLAGMASGAELGAMAGALVPGLGETGIGEIGGGLIGGLGGAFAGAAGVQEAQDWALSHLPDSWRSAIGQAPEQQQADIAAHPYATFAGELAPNLALLRPGAVAAAPEGAGVVQRALAHPVGARLVPAALMGTQEGIQEGLDQGSVDPAKVAIASGAGALMQHPTAAGRAVMRAGESLPRGVANAFTPQPEPPAPGPYGGPEFGREQTFNELYVDDRASHPPGGGGSSSPSPHAGILPAVGEPIGLKHPITNEVQHATVTGYHQNNSLATVRLGDGTHAWMDANELARDRVEPPDTTPAQKPTVPGATQAERMEAPFTDETALDQPRTPKPLPNALDPEATNALDHANMLERAANHPASTLPAETRIAMLTEAGRLRQRYGAPETLEPDYQHPLANEPAAGLGQLAVARQRRPELFNTAARIPEVMPPPSARPAQIPVDDIARAKEDIRQEWTTPLPKATTLRQGINAQGGLRTIGPNGEWYPEAKSIRSRIGAQALASITNNKTGIHPDKLRGSLAEEGWFGGNPSDDVANTTTDDLADLLDNHFRNGPVYHPGEQETYDLIARQHFRDELKAAGVKRGEGLTVASQKLARYRAEYAHLYPTEHEGAIDAALTPEQREKVESYGYEPGSDIGAEFETDEGAGAAGERPGTEAGRTPAYPDTRAQAEADRAAHAREHPEELTDEDWASLAGTLRQQKELYAAEPGAVDAQGKPLPQTIIPGAEQSAVQLAKAREAQGKGRIATKTEQKGAGPLFGETGEKGQGSLFQPGQFVAGNPGEYRDLYHDFAAHRWNANAREPLDVNDAIASYLRGRGDQTGHEALANYDANGNRVTHVYTTGAPNFVGVTEDVAVQHLDPNAHFIVHHNHPNGGSLSSEDLGFLAYPGARTIIAHAPDGTYYAASLKPAWREGVIADQKRMPGFPMARAGAKAIMNARAQAHGLARRVTDPAFSSGTLSGTEASDLLTHLTNIIMDKVGAIDYMHSKVVPAVQQRMIDYALSTVPDADPALPYRPARPVQFRDGIGKLLGVDQGLAAQPGSSPRPGGSKPQFGRRAPEGQLKLLQPERQYVEQPETPEQGKEYFDNVAHAIAADQGGGGAGNYARTLNREMGPGGRFSPGNNKALGDIQRFAILPRTLASMDWRSARYYGATAAKQEAALKMMSDYRDHARDFNQLPEASKDKVLQVAELNRLDGTVPQEGRTVVAHNANHPLAELSKPGETIRLNDAESKALFGLKDMFAQQWRDMITGTAKKLGWDGDPDPITIRQAAQQETGAGARRLNRIADIVQAFQEQERAGYIPLMRHGDYYLAVKRKVGPGDDSLGGFPRTEWYRRVDSKTPWENVFGKKATNEAKVPQSALDQIKGLSDKGGFGEFRNVDGKWQSPTHEIEMGYAPRNIDALRSLDIPAVEKLMMALEHRSGSGDRSFQSNPAYSALMDEIRDQLYDELKAGFKKRAATPPVPGYCVVPTTRILTAGMEWVPAETIKVGDELVGFEETAGATKRRCMCVATVEKVVRLRKRCVTVKLRSGRSITASEDHLLLGALSGFENRWKKAAEFRLGDGVKIFPLANRRDDFDGGWFAGFIDGEGHFTARKAGRKSSLIELGWCQLPGPVFDRSVAIARDSGLFVRSHTGKPGRVSHGSFRVWDSMLALQLFRPLRLVNSRKWVGAPLPSQWMEDGRQVGSRPRRPQSFSTAGDFVVGIESVGEMEVVGIQTSSHTFIAEGICSHNSSDFRRAMGSYSFWTSHHVADMLHGDDIQRARDEIDRGADPNVVKFWRQWDHDMETKPGILAKGANALQNFAFYWEMGANPASTFSILTHGGTVAIPTLSVGADMRTAAGAFLKAQAETLGSLKADATKGLHYGDVSQIGKTPQERAFLGDLERSGLLHSRMADEFGRIQENPFAGAFAKQGKRVLDLWGSNISAADRASRIPAALAAYRLAKRPGGFERFAKAWGNDENFKAIVSRYGRTPEAVGRFMTNEAAFEYGKRNQPAWQRNALGGLLGQFHGFQLRAFSRMLQLTSRLGPEGKKAAGMMGLTVAALAGVMGLPFVKDAETAYDQIKKWTSGRDPNIEAEQRKWLEEKTGLGKLGADMVLRGPVSTAMGVDLTDRLGFGDPISRQLSEHEFFGAAPSIIANAVTRGVERARRGDSAAAVASEVSPNAVKGPLQAYGSWPEQGVRSPTGEYPSVPRGKITPEDQARRALGFQPLTVTRAYEQREDAYRRRHARTP